MARYIDAEAFKRKLIDEKGFFPAIIARALEEMPNADVVPKNEIDRLGEKYNELLELKLANAKTEVAREIFEEIEKCMAHDYISSIGVYNGALELRIAELKKKYGVDL